MRILAVLVPVTVVAACGGDPSDPVAPSTPPDTARGPNIVAPGPYHIFGSDAMLGTYHNRHVAVEVVDGSDGGIAILQLWGGPGPDASGIALAVDEKRGWAEIHANSVRKAPRFPLILYADRVGVAQPEPHARLDVAGGVRLSGTDRPDCTDDARGTLWFERGAPDAADRMLACLRAASGTHAWTPLAP